MEGNRVIFDVGAHTGEDCEYYLGKGFSVVAFEANPILVERLRERFSEDVAGGRLTVVHAAIAETGAQQLSFFC